MAKKVILKINQVDSPTGNTLDIQGSMDALVNHDHNASYYLKAEADANITTLDNAKPTTLAGLTDTVITSPTEGQVISWVQAENAWKNTAAPPSSLSTKTDVVLTDLQDGDTLLYDGSNWVNAPFPQGGGEMPSWMRSFMTTQADGKRADSSKIVIAMNYGVYLGAITNWELYSIASSSASQFVRPLESECLTYGTEDYIYNFRAFDTARETKRLNVSSLSTIVDWAAIPSDYVGVSNSIGFHDLTGDGNHLYLCANNLYRYSLTDSAQGSVNHGSLSDIAHLSGGTFGVSVSNDGTVGLFNKGTALYKYAFASESTAAANAFGTTINSLQAASDGISSWRGGEVYFGGVKTFDKILNKESFETGSVSSLVFAGWEYAGALTATGYNVYTHGGNSGKISGTYYNALTEHSVDSAAVVSTFASYTGLWGNISTCG